MTYEVRIADETYEAIDAQADYIEQESGFPTRGIEWLIECHALIHTLETFPRRCPLAPGKDRGDYEYRKLNFGRYLIVFRVDEDAKVVHVTGFSHGMRENPNE